MSERRETREDAEASTSDVDREPRAVGFRSERGPILIALMVTTALVAIDSTILATAVPTIVSDLGGFASFPWLFSIYLLAQAVTVPVYSKLADTVGRKPIILIGITLFLLGSVLSGFAGDMTALIVFRAIQGLGAGAVQPISITIIGDLYTLRERAKVQGYLASVWAVSSVVGPTLGGVFSQFISWRWIFFVNIPLCLIAAWMLARTYHEKIDRVRHRLDYLGASLLTAALTLLILGVLEGGQAWAWNSPPSFATFAVGTALLVAFILAERRASEPVLPLWVLSRRLLGVSSLIALAVGGILLGLTSYVPTFLEGVLGAPPLIAGLALAALTIGWPISASISGRLYLVRGFRFTIVLGSVITAISAVTLAITASRPSIIGIALLCFGVGFGLGLVSTPSLIAAQGSVEWNERAVVTGANLFSRSIGSALGIAIFGAVANGVFARMHADQTDPAAVQSAAGSVFVGIAVVSVGLIAAALSLRRGAMSHTAPAHEGARA